MDVNWIVTVLLVVIAVYVHAESDEDLYDGDSCTLKDGTEGLCRIGTKCPWFVTQFLKKRKITYKDIVRCSFDNFDEIICCDERFESNEQQAPIRSERNGERISETKCREFPLYYKPLVFHITGGMKAELGEFPHMAALGYKSKKPDVPYQFNCGGSLISDNFVITAAHCCDQMNPPLIARLGKISLFSNDDGGEEEDIPIKKVLVHPNYKSSIRQNDIALLELAHNYTPKDFVYPACLYSKPFDPPLDTLFSAQGWGAVAYDDTTGSSDLLKVNLTLVETVSCNETLLNKIKFSSRRFTGVLEGQICAIGFEREDDDGVGDTCSGDSGGPMQYITNKRHHIYGITSFGLACGSKTPALYTKVSHYIDWLESVLWP